MIQKGVIFYSVSLVAPIADRIRNTRNRSKFDRLTLNLVRGYQKYLSPHKGFSCAYRKLHGDASCSEYFRQSIDRYGLSHAIPLFQQRLEACKVANLTLRSQVSEREEDSELPEKKKRQNQNLSCDRAVGDCVGYGCGDCGSSDCGDCNTPDCGDCGSSDCGSSDCGSLDCGSLDCGSCDCNFSS
jgi:putative component of membrane protein insertase Oxa1/YidC/SpoIIIJ protein YidD